MDLWTLAQTLGVAIQLDKLTQAILTEPTEPSSEHRAMESASLGTSSIVDLESSVFLV